MKQTSRAALVLLALLVACDFEMHTGPRAPIASVSIQPRTLSLVIGEKVRVAADLRDTSGNVLRDRVVAWTSSRPDVASISTWGEVTARSAGTATITATSEGKSAHAEVHVAAGDQADLVYSASPDRFGAARLYIVPGDGGAARLVVPDNVLPGWTLSGAAVSPNGRRIAFVASKQSDAFIYVVDVNGANLRQLTTGGNEVTPTWSPDGTQIAYADWSWDADIWVMNADGSGAVNLTFDWNYENQYTPAWSRDATGQSRIAFAEGNGYGYGRILTMRPNGTDVREVTPWAPGERIDQEPAWSPDGKQIVFVRESITGSGDLWVANANGTNARPLVTLRSIQADPTWSPDGRLIAFTSLHEPGDYQVYTVKADGTDVVKRSSGAFAFGPAWRGRAQ